MAATAGEITPQVNRHDDTGSRMASTMANDSDMMHAAAAAGNVDALRNLLTNKPHLLQAKNKVGDEPIHQAARHGHCTAVALMLEKGVDINVQNETKETALHLAVRNNHVELVKELLQHQPNPDLQDSRGWTPLHTACQRRFEPIAVQLLQHGCRPDVTDVNGETALHMACREDMLTVVQLLCSSGSDVDLENKAGLTPLLIAARFGSTELMRCLLLAGADLGACTKDGVKAADIAGANGRMEVAELLTKLASTFTTDRRQSCVSQLLPTAKQLDCVRVNFFGASSVGKTAMIDALKCSFVRSLLRRGGAALLSAVSSGAQTSAKPDATGEGKKNGSAIQMKAASVQAPKNVNYTRGIVIEHAHLSGVGELCLCEFSGYEPFYASYDMFVGDPNAIYVVVVSMKDKATERQRQINFWLSYLSSRMGPTEPVGFAGCKLWAPRVLIVATHADVADPTESGWDPDRLVMGLQKEFETDLIIESHIFVVDSNNPTSAEMSTLKKAFGVLKKFICEYLPAEVGLLQPVLAILPEWCRVLSAFPIVSWPSFVEYVRSRVNILATEEHIREVLNQLIVIGEVIHVHNDYQEMFVLDPEWFGTDVVGKLLAHDSIAWNRPDGRLTADDLRTIFRGAQPHDMIRLLVSMDLGTPGYKDVEMDCVVPCIDRSDEEEQTASGLPGVNGTEKPTVGGGFRLRPQQPGQLVYVFPRVVCSLRRSLMAPRLDAAGGGADDVGGPQSLPTPESAEYDVASWCRGVRIVRDRSLTATVRLDVGGVSESILVTCVGPVDRRRELFFFQENLCEIIFLAVENACPGLNLERSPLSVRQIFDRATTPHAYRPRDVILAQLAGTTCVQADKLDHPERLIDLVAFGDTEVFSHLRPGLDNSVADLPLHVRYRLAALLDPKHHLGHDWCLLAVKLDLADQVPTLSEPDAGPFSRTDAILSMWAASAEEATTTGDRVKDRVSSADVTVRALHAKLLNLDRPDVVEALLALTPLYHYEIETTQ